MQLDRWIAFVILCTSLIYGYAAFFTMDELLAPFMRRNPIWPSTFPKILSVLAVVTSFVILFRIERPIEKSSSSDMDLSELKNYKIAKDLFIKVVNLNPKYTDGFYNLANILVKLNEEEKAIEIYNKVIELDKNYFKAHF